MVPWCERWQGSVMDVSVSRRFAWMMGAFVATVLAMVSGCSSSPRSAPGERLIVRFKQAAPLGALVARGERAYPALASTTSRLAWASSIDSGMVVIEVPRSDLAAVRGRLRADPSVAYVVDDVVTGELATTPNDPEFANQFDQYRWFKSSLVAAWSVQRTSDVVVAVVDTGVAFDAPDLAPNMWHNKGEVLDGVDNDKNGIIDDLFGCEFVDPFDARSPPGKPSSEPRDFYGHGTSVASLVGAVGNNRNGLSGVVWSGKVMAIKIAAGSEGKFIWRLSDILSGIDYAIANGATILNCSWLFRGDLDSVQPLSDLMAKSPQCLFVVASGNDGQDLDATSGLLDDVWPAELPLDNIFVVGSSTGLDARTPDSNYGAKSVDIFAPGVHHRVYEVDGNGSPLTNYGSGTSFASPVVAGVCSLVWQRHPEFNPKQVKDFVVEHSDLVSALAGLCLGVDGQGCVRLNPYRAVSGDVNPESLSPH